MSKRNKTKRKKQSTHLPYILGTTKERLTSRCGLLPLAEVLKALGLKRQADALFSAPGSNRGYSNGAIVNTFILMLNEGARCLEDVSHLHTEKELLKLAGIEQIPGADTLARWLHRQGRSGEPLVHELSRTVIAETLKLLRVKCVTLDIDATAILSNKVSAKWTYLKCRGFMPIVGTLAESGQVVAVEFRDGNVSPSYDNAGFIKTCQAQLPVAVELKRVRIDAAGYQKGLIEDLARQKIEFVIRAAMDSAVKEAIAAVAETDWQPFRLSDGSLSQHEWVARRTHIMHRSDTAFDLVIQRRLKSEASDLPNQRELPGLSTQTQFETNQYVYRVIATNIERLDDSQIVHEYNQRGEYSENRIKELKSDFAASRPPCSDFAANALYVCMCALAYNVFALMRTGLPSEFRFARVPTLRVRLFGLAAKIVRHGHQWMIRLHETHRRLLNRVLATLHENIGWLLPDMRYPLLR